MDAADHKALQREILLGLWKVHILHHAREGPVVGQWMLRELRSHGYDVSPGTLYPILHRMERLGWLISRQSGTAGTRSRRAFYATSKGEEVFRAVLEKLGELTGETGSRLGLPRKGARGKEEAERNAP